MKDNAVLQFQCHVAMSVTSAVFRVDCWICPCGPDSGQIACHICRAQTRHSVWL